MTSIIFDQNKINEELITNYMNNIHKYSEFNKRGKQQHNPLGPLHREKQ